MAELNREDLRRLARLGAAARLQELRREEAAIRSAFPELFKASTRPVAVRGAEAAADAPAAAPRRRRRRRSAMSAEARRAVSERMKKYWADRRKAKPAKR